MGLVSRFACIFAPALPLQALLRVAPGLRQGPPLAIVEGEGSRIVASTASAAGVVPGMTCAEARARVPLLELRPLSAALCASAEGALLDLAEAFSPLYELTPGAGEVVLEIGDLGRLYPSEVALGEALLTQAARLHLSVHVCIAGNPQVARRVARICPQVTVLPWGLERAALAGLPIEALPLRDEDAAILRGGGLRHIGDLAALPRVPLAPSPPPARIFEAVDLPGPAPLWPLMRGLFDRLLERLALRGRRCDRCWLRMDVQAHADERELVPLEATLDGAVLLELARRELSARRPAAPVRRVAVWCAAGLSPRSAEARQQPEPLATTLARLEAEYGQGRVGAKALADDYLTEQVHLLSFPGDFPGGREGPLLALRSRRMKARALRPPFPAEVVVVDGVPTVLRSDVAVSGVLRFAGPLRARVGFGGPVLRDYYDIELVDGMLLRIFQDLSLSSWFIEAIYETARRR